ncbi:MAG: hypothetical protein KJ710_01950 [Candidatus Omnitrophica bacterium]|nr:hypothetical protein [Candidatus Omnitrophota bacterium]MBU1923014.1 hypothetical protein [Candidatus Omnitrophota bacterium]
MVWIHFAKAIGQKVTGRIMLKLFFSVLFLFGIYANSFAAVGCSLDDPDRDVKRLFPASTGYLTKFVTLKEIGAEVIQNKIEEELGDKLDLVYENLDVPYAYYTVLKGKDPIGYIHGVNQKGRFGGLQLVVAIDLEGKIIAFYYQRISSPESSKFRGIQFTSQFKGLSLADFSKYNISNNSLSEGRITKIADLSANSSEDFRATMRGIKKNLILLNEFLHEAER